MPVNFDTIENYTPVYADCKVSQRVLLRLTRPKGSIRTSFHEIYAATGGRYDVGVRYHAQAKGTATFRLHVGGRPQGESWKTSAGDGSWKSHSVKGVPLARGDEIVVQCQAEEGAAGELDYVQLDHQGGALLPFDRLK